MGLVYSWYLVRWLIPHTKRASHGLWRFPLDSASTKYLIVHAINTTVSIFPAGGRLELALKVFLSGLEYKPRLVYIHKSPNVGYISYQGGTVSTILVKSWVKFCTVSLLPLHRHLYRWWWWWCRLLMVVEVLVAV